MVVIIIVVDVVLIVLVIVVADANIADDMDYFIRLDDEYYAASDQSIQVAMAVTQRISGALQDALPEDADVQAMAERMKQLRKDNSDRQRGQFSDPPVFDPDAQP